MSYVELHAHSSFSLLDGVSSPEVLVTQAAELRMSALALTDHNALYGAVPFVEAAKSHGIHPILGAEITLEDGHHLTLLVENAQGDLAQAMTFFTEALGLFRELGEQDAVAQTQLEVGCVALTQGDDTRAAECFAESLGLFRETGNRRDTAYCLERLAGVAGARRQVECAVRLFGAAEALREAVGIPLPLVLRADYEREVAAARSQLNETAFVALWAEGRVLPLEQAIAEALHIPLDAQPAQMDAGVTTPALQTSGAAPDRLGTLTPRERQVLVLVAQGYTNRAIAETLVIAERTDEIHASSILGKLGLTSRTQAATYALAHGLVAPPDA